MTALSSNLEAFARRRADLSLLQETTCTPSQISEAKGFLAKTGDRQLQCGCLDPNRVKPTGGIAAIASDKDTLFSLEPLAPSFQRACELGRAGLIAFGKGKASKLLHFYIVYGYTNGKHAPAQAAATCKLFSAIYDDILLRPQGATFIVGDFNADLEDIPSALIFTEELQWQDLGAIAQQWGQPAEAPTCTVANANEPTRRDFILASPMAIPMVTHFQVSTGDVCPTHATLTMHVAIQAGQCSLQQSRTPHSLNQLIHTDFSTLFGVLPERLNKEDILDPDWAHDHPEDAHVQPGLQVC